MCGTYEWEWENNRFAYEPATHLCRGCQLLDAEREDSKPGPGVRLILIPQKRAEELHLRGR